MTQLQIKTADGMFTAFYTEKGLAELHFPNDKRNTKSPASEKVSTQVRDWHHQTTKVLKAMLAGKNDEKLPPLDLSVGTDFQREVWKKLRQITMGRTRSYAEIAESMGNPKAMRAVGGACGANPIPILIPCHRVLAANKKLGGFTSGLPWKRKLLAREGVGYLLL